MNRFKELKIWQVSVELAVDVYKTTMSYPKEEIYSLTNQTRRSAVSIPSNIAEGANRKGTNEFINFLSIASGSAGELQTQLIIANKLAFIDNTICAELVERIDHIQNMNFKLQESLNKKAIPTVKKKSSRPLETQTT